MADSAATGRESLIQSRKTTKRPEGRSIIRDGRRDVSAFPLRRDPRARVLVSLERPLGLERQLAERGDAHPMYGPMVGFDTGDSDD